MSSSRVDSNDTGGPNSLRNLSKDNSSTERIQHQLSNFRFTREASPIRRGGSPIANNMSGRATPSYRRKTARATLSSRESSPSRQNPSSGTRASQLQSSSLSSQHAGDTPLSSRLQRTSLGKTPQWPNSPRLGSTSKHPSRSPALSPKKTTEQVPVNAFEPSALQRRVETVSKNINSDDTDNLDLPPSGMRTPRSTTTPALETVVESSLPSTPAIGTSRILAEKVSAVQARDQKAKAEESQDGDTTEESTTPTGNRSIAPSLAPSRTPSVIHSTAESESESGYRSEDKFYRRATNTTSPTGPSATLITRRPTLVNTLQPGPDSLRNMTVETETVTSMTQLGGGPGGAGASIRSKKSSDTIRAPRKEKKKRATPVMSSANPAASKAEFFGAQVAAAVHEANSEDSDETFVYESNPPDKRPTAKFHSRTPSATSIHGGPRNYSLHDQPGPVSTKGKMKFAGNRESSNASIYGDVDSGNTSGNYGTIIVPGGPGSGYSGPSRNGNSRHGSTSNRSILADESPFAIEHKAQPLRNPGMSHISSRNLVSPTRSHIRSGAMNANGYSNGGGSKRNSRILAPSRYGADDEGDDERAPLMRSNRTRRRPPSGSLRQIGHNEHRRRGWIGRFAACLFAIVTVLLVILGTVGVIFATSKPLQDVQVLNMTDVLVSQQEIMLDLVVQAVNPNMIGITVQAMDVNLFAKSSWVRDDKDQDKDPDGGDLETQRGEHNMGETLNVENVGNTFAQFEPVSLLKDVDTTPYQGRHRVALSPSTRHHEEKALRSLPSWLHPKKGVDEGTDPDPNLPDKEDRQTMLLGRIFQFDSALSFDASPFQHHPTISKGGLRLAKPGNKTEKGGTERWERVILHPFELIVRGVLKYQLPLSGRVRTASIGGSVMVNPADNNIEVSMEE